MSSRSWEVVPRQPAVVVRPGEHACCRFTAAEDRLRVALDVVRDGVQRGDQRLDELEFPATIRLCQYDHASIGGERASAVACSHDVDLAPELAAIGREGMLAAGRLRSGALRLAGEVDFEGAPALAGVVGADALEPVPLDLADVSFVDVSGMRALRGGADRPLAIMGASAPVSRLLALLAWDTDPAVEISEPA
jgi:hypothetical protein